MGIKHWMASKGDHALAAQLCLLPLAPSCSFLSSHSMYPPSVTLDAGSLLELLMSLCSLLSYLLSLSLDFVYVLFLYKLISGLSFVFYGSLPFCSVLHNSRPVSKMMFSSMSCFHILVVCWCSVPHSPHSLSRFSWFCSCSRVFLFFFMALYLFCFPLVISRKAFPLYAVIFPLYFDLMPRFQSVFHFITLSFVLLFTCICQFVKSMRPQFCCTGF